MTGVDFKGGRGGKLDWVASHLRFGEARDKKWKTVNINNHLHPKSALIDFTLSNDRQFYSSKGDTLRVKGSRQK